MNYHGRVMELDLGWPVAELRCMAAEMAAEADQEIARLRRLIDGAMDIVELWRAETPSQIKWRADWLAGARDAVGSRP